MYLKGKQLSPEAAAIFEKMGQGMRLVVPFGEAPCKLVADPRWPRYCPDQEVSATACLELQESRLISALPEHLTDNKIGWRESGFAELGETAGIFACTQ